MSSATINRIEVQKGLQKYGLKIFKVYQKKPLSAGDWDLQDGLFDADYGVNMKGINVFVIDLDVIDNDMIKVIDSVKHLTYIVQSGKGYHLYFRTSDIFFIEKVSKALMKGGNKVGDLKHNGYVIGEGSEHYTENDDKFWVKTGKIYTIYSEKRDIFEIDEIGFNNLMRNLGVDSKTDKRKKLIDFSGVSLASIEQLTNIDFERGSRRPQLRSLYIKLRFSGLSEEQTIEQYNKKNSTLTEPLTEQEVSENIASAEKWVEQNKTSRENEKEHRNNKNTKKDLTKIICTDLMSKRTLYSNKITNQIYENAGGYLEDITHDLKRILAPYDIEELQYHKVLFYLTSNTESPPETNDDLVYLKSGVYSYSAGKLITTDELATIGFKDVEFIPEQTPKECIKVFFDNIPEDQHERMKRALSAVIRPELDTKISVIHGISGVGKTTPLTLLHEALGNYAMSVTIDAFLTDKPTQSKVLSKLLVIFQELPKTFKDFTPIKTFTGETRLTVRGLYSEPLEGRNITKFFATTNNLFKIPREEEDAMFTRRLSLITNTRKTAYKEDTKFAQRIIEKERDQLISWLIRLSSEYEYEDKDTVRNNWKTIQAPEIGFLDRFYDVSDERTEVSLKSIINHYELYTKSITDPETMAASLKSLTFSVKNSIISNIKPRPEKKAQETL